MRQAECLLAFSIKRLTFNAVTEVISRSSREYTAEEAGAGREQRG